MHHPLSRILIGVLALSIGAGATFSTAAPATRPNLLDQVMQALRQSAATRASTQPAPPTTNAEQPASHPILSRPAPTPVPCLANPAISPDGSEIAFASGGDIWTVSSHGGEAHLLISHPATEGRPLYSPDGKQLAFISNRAENTNIYLFTFATGQITRLTYGVGADMLDAWSPDGKWIYFTTTAHEVGGTCSDVYRVSSEGGTPMPVIAEPYASEFFSAPAPDGTTVAYCAGGMSLNTWPRTGHSHADECEIYIMRDATLKPGNQPATRPAPDFYPLTDLHARALWPMVSRDGGTIYFVSDAAGADNLYAVQPGTRQSGENPTPKPITHFTEGRILWPTLGNQGRTIVFERDFGIWRMDLNDPHPHAEMLNIRLRGASAGTDTLRYSLVAAAREMALSPDGKKIAFVAHGDVFAVPAATGGEATRITHSASSVESQIAWSPDSNRLVYVSDRDGPAHLFMHDFPSEKEYRLTRGTQDDAFPRFSPDGRFIAFQRAGSDVVLLDLNSGTERIVVSGQLFQRPPLAGSNRCMTFSPRGDYLGFIATGKKGFANIMVTSTLCGEVSAGLLTPWQWRQLPRQAPEQVSFLGNFGSNDLCWSPDGAYLLMGTGQRTEDFQLARIDLRNRTPKFREEQFRDLFHEPHPLPSRLEPPPPTTAPAVNPATAPATLPATLPHANPRVVLHTPIVFERIRQRLSLLPVGFDVDELSISPDGQMAVLEGTSAGQSNLYLYPLDDSIAFPRPRQLTSTAGRKAHPQFSPDGHEIYYLDAGRLSVINIETRVARLLPITVDVDVDFNVEKFEVFRQTWRYLRENFFDERMNHVAWEDTYFEYAPRIAGCKTPDELRRVLGLMLGTLNASHVNIRGSTVIHETSARLGVAFDRVAYERNGQLRITDVTPMGPADAALVHVGDQLLAIDGHLILPGTSLEALLMDKAGKLVRLHVISGNWAHTQRDVVVRPISAVAERALMYRQWVEQRRAYVERISHGRLGYIHIPDMSQTEMARLNSDLDAENESRQGVVIDVRNNLGGFVNGYALDVFARRDYLTMVPRGYPPISGRIMLGQRALTVPTALVTNRLTLSDAEDFTEGYRALKMGPVVGEPTGGWIIFTSELSLLDGSVLAIPTTKVLDHDGQVMEQHPRPVDEAVLHPVGESYESPGEDAQIAAAVHTLLKQLEEKENTARGAK